VYPASQTGRWRHYVLRLSVLSFVCSSIRSSVCLLQTCEQGILKTSQPTLMQIGTSGPQRQRIKWSTLGVRRSNVTKIGLEAWRRHHFCIVKNTLNLLNLQRTSAGCGQHWCQQCRRRVPFVDRSKNWWWLTVDDVISRATKSRLVCCLDETSIRSVSMEICLRRSL